MGHEGVVQLVLEKEGVDVNSKDITVILGGGELLLIQPAALACPSCSEQHPFKPMSVTSSLRCRIPAYRLLHVGT